MDTNRAFWSTSRPIRLILLCLGFATSSASAPARALAQSAGADSIRIAPPAGADSSAAPPAAHPSAAAPVTPAAPVRALGCADGERDADNQHDPFFYGVGGALAGPFGIGFALMKRPEPKLASLAGQSPGAATEYTRCFGNRARKKNIKAAANGFAISALAAMVAIFYMDSKTAP